MPTIAIRSLLTAPGKVRSPPSPVASGGFGYDPIFVPAGMHSTAAQLTPEQKNEVSHRAQALRAWPRSGGRPGPGMTEDPVQPPSTRRGNLFVIAAPSGAGKTSLVKALLERMPQLHVSISHTTRQQRPTEQPGREYYFVRVRGVRASWCSAVSSSSTRACSTTTTAPRAAGRGAAGPGHDVVLEIDWQGAQQVRTAMPDCLTIFILPPSRARSRGAAAQPRRPTPTRSSSGGCGTPWGTCRTGGSSTTSW